MTKKQYAYLIIESTTKSVNVGDIITDEVIKEQDYTWKIFNLKSREEPKYFRGLRLCELPEDKKESEKLIELIYNAMRKAVK